MEMEEQHLLFQQMEVKNNHLMAFLDFHSFHQDSQELVQVQVILDQEEEEEQDFPTKLEELNNSIEIIKEILKTKAEDIVIDAKGDCIHACGDVTLSGSGNYDLDVDLESTYAEDGIYSLCGNITIATTGTVDIVAPYAIEANGAVDISASGNVILDGVFDGIWAISDITISGSGDVNVTCDNSTFVTCGNLILSGTGKVIGTSEEEYCVVLYIKDGNAGTVLLNGKNPEVSFTTASASDEHYAVSEGEEDNVKHVYTYHAGTVAGNNLAKYDVEGAPGEKSVVYTWRTYNVTFDMGGHGTAPENQKVTWDETIEKPEDPTADGFKFEGWYSDRACTKAFDFEVAYNVDMTVFAKWTCLHKNTEVRDAKDASLTEKGYTGDTYCKDCGEKLESGKAIPTLTPEPSGEPTPSPKPSGEPTPTSEPTPTNNPTPSGEPTPTPTVPPTTPTPEPELNVGDFVDRCYEVALGREADEDGYNYWKEQLINGQACGAQVGFGFIFSQEYLNKEKSNEDFVNDLYAMFFGREADSEGYAYWLSALENGDSRENIFAGFANSQEFYDLCKKYAVVSGWYAVGIDNGSQGGVNCFVARLYKICFKRLPDLGGQAYWVSQLIDGSLDGTTAASGFVFSAEFTNLELRDEEFVAYMYAAFFARKADVQGFNYWMTEIRNGMSRNDVFSGFTGSAEFINLCDSYGIIA